MSTDILYVTLQINISYSLLPSTLNLTQQAKFFAQFGTAISDASITVWKVKYTNLFWRPITAIRLGYGNASNANASWTPLLSTPNHPEYPSGHQATVGAALGVLRSWLGGTSATENLSSAITVASEGVDPSVLRTYTNLTAIAYEVGDSRVYGGVHYNNSGYDGLALGLQVAKNILQIIQ